MWRERAGELKSPRAGGAVPHVLRHAACWDHMCSQCCRCCTLPGSHSVKDTCRDGWIDGWMGIDVEKKHVTASCLKKDLQEQLVGLNSS